MIAIAVTAEAYGAAGCALSAAHSVMSRKQVKFQGPTPNATGDMGVVTYPLPRAIEVF